MEGPKPERPRGGAPRLVAVVGSKGGCGATTITANLAAELAGDHSVCAIDLDFGRGDLAGLLDLTPTASIPALLAGNLDVALLRGSAVRHRGGFAVLAQPAELLQVVRPSPAEVKRLLEVALATWELVLADCGDRVDEATLAALPLADRVLIVATLDVLAIRNVVRLRTLLREIGVPPERQWLVLNKVPRHPTLAIEEVEELLKLRASATLQDDQATCQQAAYEGKTIHDLATSSALTRDFTTLWSRLNGEPVPTRSRLSWLGGMS